VLIATWQLLFLMLDLTKIKAANNKTLSVLKALVLAVFNGSKTYAPSALVLYITNFN
jgi:hypothetical protein